MLYDHHFNTHQLIKEKTTNLVADQKYKKWLCPEMHDSESTHHELLMVHSSIYCQIELIDSKEHLVHWWDLLQCWDWQGMKIPLVGLWDWYGIRSNDLGYWVMGN